MRIETDYCSDRGRNKPNNEDAGGVYFGGRLLIVADGMGGGQAGEYAAQQAVAQVREVVAQAKYYIDGVGVRVEGPGRAVGAKGLALAIQHANTFLYSMSRTQPTLRGMGTTVVCCLIENGRAYFANVGDSRGCLVRNGQLRQVTRDHSLISDPKAGATNIITRALGPKSYVEVEVFEETLQAGDGVLLCSDGLSKVVAGQVIASALTHPHLLSIPVAPYLVHKANDAGGPDNITVAYARVTDLPDEPCTGAWQAPAEEQDDDHDETVGSSRGRQTPGLTAGGMGSRLRALGVGGGWSGSVRWWAAAAAGVVLCGAVLTVLVRPGSGKPSAGQSQLLVEVHRLRSEPQADTELSVSDGGRRLLAATIRTLPGGRQRLDVTEPLHLVEPLDANSGSPFRVPLPATVGAAALLRVGGGSTLPDGTSEVTLAQAWDLKLNAYRVVIVSSRFAAGWKSVVSGMLGGNARQAEQEYTRIEADFFDPADAAKAKAWMDRMKGMASDAEALSSSLGSGRMTMAAFSVRYQELLRNAREVDDLRPAGAPSVEAMIADGQGRAGGARVARAVAALKDLEAARDEAQRALSAGGEARPTTVARYQAMLQAAGFQPSADDRALAQQVGERVAAPAPPARERSASTAGALAVAATGAPVSQQLTPVPALVALKTALEELQRRHHNDMASPELAQELNEVRARCVTALGAFAAPGGGRATAEQRAASRDVARQWLIVENWVSHRLLNQQASLRPRPDAVATLEGLAAFGVDAKMLGAVREKYGQAR